MAVVSVRRPVDPARHPPIDTPVSPRPVVVIRPPRGWPRLRLHELWEYRDLVLILAARDVRLRYKQTALGITWVVAQPLVAALLFAVIFGRLARLPAAGEPYVLFAFCGLLAWNLFAGILQRAGTSLVGDARLISKVHFPRLILPLASCGAVLVDFAVSLAVFAVLLPVYGRAPGWRALTLPFWLLLCLMGAGGIALTLAALNVRYRDVMYALPFVIQVWLFVTPVVYAGTLIPAAWRPLYSLNPAAGYVEGFRWALLGRGTVEPLTTAITVAVSLLLLGGGALVFRHVEREFADVI